MPCGTESSRMASATAACTSTFLSVYVHKGMLPDTFQAVHSKLGDYLGLAMLRTDLLRNAILALLALGSSLAGTAPALTSPNMGGKNNLVSLLLFGRLLKASMIAFKKPEAG